MAKTNPIGVRFDEELLNKVKDANIASSPQKALNLYEKSYVELVEKKVEENNKPENKKIILEERAGIKTDAVKTDETNPDNEIVLKAIEAINAEKIPPHRDTVFGKKSWKQEQDKKIADLQNLLKQ
jgi:tRNA U34 5-methylaminomethyl-2-thiouridine-forming methyltransferase MnmC